MIPGRVPLPLRQECERIQVQMGRKKTNKCTVRSGVSWSLSVKFGLRCGYLTCFGVPTCTESSATMAAPEPIASDWRTSSKAHLEVEHTIVDVPMPWILTRSGRYTDRPPRAHLRGGDATQIGNSSRRFHLVLRFAANNDRGAFYRRFNAAGRGENRRAHPDPQRSITERTSIISSMTQRLYCYRIWPSKQSIARQAYCRRVPATAEEKSASAPVHR